MILRKHDRVLVQGITGKQGTFWTEKMQAYGAACRSMARPARRWQRKRTAAGGSIARCCSSRPWA
jgi:succinyl-CoA synthetase alpha subunit